VQAFYGGHLIIGYLWLERLPLTPLVDGFIVVLAGASGKGVEEMFYSVLHRIGRGRQRQFGGLPL